METNRMNFVFLLVLSFATVSFRLSQTQVAGGGGGGTWTVLNENIGVPAMHMQLLHNNKVVIFDRTDVGPSNLTIPGPCRRMDKGSGKPDCTAHSLIYDIASNTYRPLFFTLDVWCSSASVHPDGTLVQTGGYGVGEKKVRLFKPCDDDKCDWLEQAQDLYARRWYASNVMLPDARIITIGGAEAHNYEFFPKDPSNPVNLGLYSMPFLRETLFRPWDEHNLYPFAHLMPDGNIFLFANRRSILFDYNRNRVIREYPVIPGESRSYPATGSSAMLPLRPTLERGDSCPVEILICGGTTEGNSLQSMKGIFLEASRTCGRMVANDPNPQWVMEEMPSPRVMSDMINLPSGDVLILNGARRGTAKWESGDDPNLTPVLYKPKENDPKNKFQELTPTTIPRMYHACALLMADGRIFVAGSNPHGINTFTGKYPTELRLEAFSPGYLARPEMRPRILTLGATNNDPVFFYGQKIQVTVTLKASNPDSVFEVVLIYPAFVTHSVAMNQRMLVLPTESQTFKQPNDHTIIAHGPASATMAPPGYYMLFVVHDGIPSDSQWVKIDYEDPTKPLVPNNEGKQ